MVERFARSLAAGCLVGVVVQEALWTGLGMLDPAGSLNRALVSGPQQGSIWGPLLAAWLTGGFAAALMATLVGRSRWSGYGAGALMSLSAWCLCRLAWPESGALSAVAATPLLGAALGTGIALRVLMGDETRRARPSVVTLRGLFP